MSTADKIVEALEKMLQEARLEIDPDEDDLFDYGFVRGLEQALSKAMSIRDGFK